MMKRSRTIIKRLVVQYRNALRKWYHSQIFAGCLKYLLKCLNFLQVLHYTSILPVLLLNRVLQPLLIFRVKFSNEKSLPFIHESGETGMRF